MAKKKSDMTLMERVERELKGASWEEAEEIGMRILGRCMAKRLFIGGETEYNMATLAQKIMAYGDEWVRDNESVLSIVLAGLELKNEQIGGQANVQ